MPVILTPPRRRAGVRAALAGVLVVGVVLGLVATTLVIDGNDNRAAAESAGLPIEGEPATQPPAREVEHEVVPAVVPGADSIATTGAEDPEAPAEDASPPRPAGSFAAMESSRRLREAARDPKKLMAKPRTREPVAPAVTRPAVAAPASPTSPPAPPASTSSPSASSEDLYDTR